MSTEQEIQEFLVNQQKIKELTERNEEILDTAGFRSKAVGTYQLGRFVVDVMPNVRFSSKKAEELYPFNDENIELYSPTITSAKAKEILSGADYAKTQDVFPKNKVSIRIAE